MWWVLVGIAAWAVVALPLAYVLGSMIRLGQEHDIVPSQRRPPRGE